MARKKNTDSRVFITPAGLEMLCKEIWGEGWRASFSEWTGITYSQLHRYMTVYNGQRIPKIVVLALVGLRDLNDLGKPSPDASVFEADASESVPVKFQQKKKARIIRTRNDAPLIDIFSTAAPVPQPEPERIPEPPAAEPEPPTPEPQPEPAKKAVARTAKTGKAGPETGKAGQGRTKPAAKKKPAATKAKEPAKARPRRAALSHG